MTYPSHSKFFLTLFFCCIFAAQSFSGVMDEISTEVSQVFEKTSPCVVRITSVDSIAPLAGTGFFIDTNGTILTSAAVVGNIPQAKVDYKNKSYDALVLSRDMRSGIALLKIEESQTPTLKFGDSDALKAATGVISVGYPFNLPVAPNFGMVAGFDVQYLNRFFATTHIRANLSVSPGQIGGPLMNAKGEVVGMIAMAIDDGKGCYAIPSNSIRKITGDMAQYGEARHGWVGVGVVQEKENDSTVGVVKVSQLFQETPAAMSGIQLGDRVLKIGERDIKNPSDVLDAAFFAEIGKKTKVLVDRKGQTLAFEIDIRERPQSSRLVDAKPIPLPAAALPEKNLKAYKISQPQQ